MKEFEKAKQDYESIPIPEELSQRVQAGIRQGRDAHRRSARRPLYRTVGTCAACLAVLAGALNLSPAFAAAAADVPVLGGVFQVLTVRDYTTQEGQTKYDVTVPEIEAAGDTAQAVNAQIQERVDDFLAEAQQVLDDYEEAFLATGGTQEEWDARNMEVSADYEILYQTDTTVSFVVRLTQSVFSAYNDQVYYTLDLAQDRELTLADLLGEDWVEICNDSINAQIEAAGEDGMFFAPNEGGFTTVDETTQFYLNQDGQPVVVFQPYTIAAGAAGTVEFLITG